MQQVNSIFVYLIISNNDTVGKKKGNHWIPEIEFFIKIMNEVLPVTATEWDAIAEHHYTFSLNSSKLASP